MHWPAELSYIQSCNASGTHLQMLGRTSAIILVSIAALPATEKPWLLSEVNLLCNCGAEATGMFLNEQIFLGFAAVIPVKTITMAFTYTVGATADTDWSLAARCS